MSATDNSTAVTATTTTTATAADVSAAAVPASSVEYLGRVTRGPDMDLLKFYPMVIVMVKMFLCTTQTLRPNPLVSSAT